MRRCLWKLDLWASLVGRSPTWWTIQPPSATHRSLRGNSALVRSRHTRQILRLWFSAWKTLSSQPKRFAPGAESRQWEVVGVRDAEVQDPLWTGLMLPVRNWRQGFVFLDDELVLCPLVSNSGLLHRKWPVANSANSVTETELLMWRKLRHSGIFLK